MAFSSGGRLLPQERGGGLAREPDGPGLEVPAESSAGALAGLIRKIEHTNRYVLTPDGIKFAVFYTKVHGRLLRPLMAADQPQAPPELRQASVRHAIPPRPAFSRNVSPLPLAPAIAMIDENGQLAGGNAGFRRAS